MAGSSNHLALYMASLFITALPFSFVGPLIPFMASDLGIDETEYSIMFIWISVATFSAAIVYKILGKNQLLPKYHTTLIVCCLEIAIFSVVFTFMKTRNTQIIIICIIKFFNYVIVVVANICLMVAPPKKDIGMWMSFSHGAYGFGSLTGPILVGFLEQKVYFVVAASCLLIIPFLFFISSPEHMEKSAE
jgi:MFS family permease